MHNNDVEKQRSFANDASELGHAWSASDLLQTNLERTDTRLKGIVAQSGYAIRVDDVTWEAGGAAHLRSDLFFVHWTPSRSARIEIALHGGAFRRMGPVVFLPPNTSMAYRWESGRSHSVSCSFAGLMLEQAGSLLSGLQEVGLGSMLDTADPYVEAAMLRISEEVMEPGLDSDVAIGCLILSLGSSLHRSLRRRPGSGLARHSVSSRQLAAFTDMIRDWEGKLPPLKHLASCCQVPLADIARSVRQATGLTLRAFIARERLSRAKALLREEAILIKQVSFRCGFASPAAFTAAFRKNAGLTPAEYRLHS